MKSLFLGRIVPLVAPTLRPGFLHYSESVFCRVYHTNSFGVPRVCIVGSGPAGFGVAEYLLKNHNKVHIDMIEKNPVPYGLIRYGVSPDHQDVKNCINVYKKLAKSKRFSFFGGVEVGNAVPLSELIKTCDAVVICTGAQDIVKLEIPGENLENVYSSKEFVGWYNGDPEYEHITPDLSGKTAVIVGVGNVALDCARMLLKTPDELNTTDITSYSFEMLEKSNIKNVIVIGRRGPLQMACSRRELSEITTLQDVVTMMDHSLFTADVQRLLKGKNLKTRKVRRVAKHLHDETKDISEDTEDGKKCIIKLFRTPIEILGESGKVSGILLQKNELVDVASAADIFYAEARPTDEIEEVQSTLVITAIGYGNSAIDDSIPISNGKLEMNRSGRVNHHLPIYACGWCKIGAQGVLGDTVNDCLVTGNYIIRDINSGAIHSDSPREISIEDVLRECNIKFFTWNDWEKIDKYEVQTGRELGKVREKVISWDDMRRIASCT